MPVLASTSFRNGYGKGSVAVVSGTTAIPLESVQGTQDGYIVKYDSSGKSIWSARIGSTGSDAILAISIDSSNNIYVAGNTGSGNSVTAYNYDGSSGKTLQTVSGIDAFIAKYSSSGIVQWIARIGSTGNDYGFSVKADVSGNVYVGLQGGSGVAITAYNADGSAFGTTVPNAGVEDIGIVKYDTNGVVQWVTRLASTGTDIPYAMSADSSGNVYVTGQTGATGFTAYNANGSAFATTLPTAGSSEAFLVKYNSSGTVQWLTRVASPGADIGLGLGTDPSGNVYVGGYGGTGTIVSYNAGGSTFPTTLTNAGSSDCFITKYDTNGTVLWNSRIASSGTDVIFALAVDSSGNVYVNGFFGTATVTFSNSNGTPFGTLVSTGGNDTFVAKYNTSGFVQWFARIASVGGDTGYGVNVDSNGNVYTIGYGAADLPILVYNSNNSNNSLYSTLASVGNQDVFLVKYDPNGNVLWATRLASDGSDQSRGIVIDSSNNIYLTGLYTGSSVAAYNNQVSIFSSIPSAGGTDGFIVKYNSSGSPQWVARIASTAADIVYGSTCDSTGNVYVTGQSGSAVTLIAYNAGGSAFTPTLATLGLNDAFIIKYDPNGIVLWVTRIGSTAADVAYAIQADNSGNIYVVGGGGAGTITAYNASGSAFATTLPDGGGGDAFLIKYNTSGNVQWLARMSSQFADIAYAIAVDPSGNIIVTGSGGAGTVTVFDINNTGRVALTNIGGTDAFIASYTPAGGVNWAAKIASTGADIGYAVTTDASGNVYVTGQGGSAVAVTAYNASQTAVGTALTSVGSNDVFIVKYDNTGNVLWSARIGSTAADLPYSITTDLFGNLYVSVVNASNNAINIYSSNGTLFATTGATSDAYIVKYDPNGIVLWWNYISGTSNLGNDIIQGLACDSLGNLYAACSIATTGGGTEIAVIYNRDLSIFQSISGGSLIVKYSSEGFGQWIQQVRGVAALPRLRALAIDANNNVYMSGSTSSGETMTVYSINATPYRVLSTLGTDAYVVKYSGSNSTPLWIALIQSTGVDSACEITTDTSGNIYVVGLVGGTATFYNSDGTAFPTILQNAGGNDGFIVKYTSAGLVTWVTRIASTGNDVVNNINVDSAGNFYVTGQGGSGVTVTAYNADGTAFATTIPSSGVEEAFIAKYNSSGFVQWTARLSSTGTDIGYGVATDSSNSVYMVGQGGSGAAITAFNANGTAFGTTLAASGSTTGVIAKYNSTGAVQWMTKIDSTNVDVIYQIAFDTTGNFYVVGENSGTSTIYNFDGSSFGTTQSSGSLIDVFIVKYNSSGVAQWRAAIQSSLTERGYSLAVDPSGNVYVTGISSINFSFFNANGTTGGTFSGSGGWFYIVKYSTTGTVLWFNKIGNANNNPSAGYGVITDSAGNVYCTGFCNGPMIIYNTSQVAIGSFIMNQNDIQQAFIVKYDSSGVFQWITTFAGRSTNNFGRAIASDAQGNVIGVGQIQGAGFVAYTGS